MFRYIAERVLGLFGKYRQPTIRSSDRGIFDPFIPITSLKRITNDYEADYELTEQRETFEENIPPPSEMIILRFMILVVTSIIAVRLIGLQITQGQENFSLAEGNRLEVKPTPAPRGLIYDRKGVLLVNNEPGFSLILHPTDLPQKEDDRGGYIEQLAISLDRSVTELKERVEPNVKRESITLEDNITRERALSLEIKLQGLRGIELVKFPNRHYVDLPSLGHLVGYTGKVTADDLKSRSHLLSTSLVGKAGLERSYDDMLQGAPGTETLETDSRGKTIRPIGSTLPIPGKSLILNLDADLQRVTADALKQAIEKNGAKSGAAVVLDTRTGGVLAMVSFPSFDNNLFSSSVDTDARKEVLTNPDAPLINRAIAGQYPSGSTIKPFVAAAALEERTISSDTLLDTSEGKITVGPNTFSDWKTHGVTDVAKAIAESNNIFFYALGGGYKHIPGLGIERLKNYFERFGFGVATGIDLGEGAEAVGLVPDPAWKKRVKKEAWYLGDTYITAIGQGNLLVTPLQIARGTAAIANGGKLLQPTLVRTIIYPNGRSEEIEGKILKEGVADESVLAVVRNGMRQAVTHGSARSFISLPVEVAAKTGTAQTSKSKDRTHSWFTSFAPYTSPEIAVSVIVEGGGEGFAVAAPVAKNAIEKYFNLPITPITPAIPTQETLEE